MNKIIRIVLWEVGLAVVALVVFLYQKFVNTRLLPELWIIVLLWALLGILLAVGMWFEAI